MKFPLARFAVRIGLVAFLATLVGTGRAQEVLPLPPVETSPTATPETFDPLVTPVGGVVPAAAPQVAATYQLSEADVERIVAEYLARREAERGQTPASPVSSVTTLDAATIDALPEPYVVGSDKKLTAQWNNGLEFQSANKDFKVHVGGRTQLDSSFFAGNGYLSVPASAGGINGSLSGGGSQPLADSIQFRRARLRVDGTIYEQIEFAMEYEFLNDVGVDGAATPPVATTVPAATDLWVNFTKLPILGSVKVGNQKNPIGFEHLESSRYLDFIERSFNQDLFYGPFNNGFSPGIMASNVVLDKRASWAAGFFAANMDAGTNISGYGIGNNYCYSTRGTILPYYEQDGRYMLHLGATYEFRDADDGRVRVRTRGNIRNGPPGPFNAVYADTTSMLASNQQLVNFEAVFQWGALLLQSEYCVSQIGSATQIPSTFAVAAPTYRGNVWVSGGYVEALYFLTGENRAYSHERAAFDRVVPYANAFRVLGRKGRICRGSGAWQVGIRYDHADLNDSGVNGGMLDAMTLGINWFLNPNMKLQLNGDWTHRGQVARTLGTTAPGDVFGIGTRMAIDY